MAGFLACEESCWNFFRWFAKFESPHGGELGGDLVSAKHNVYAGREEQ